VYDKKEGLNLNQEQSTLLQETFDAFVDRGANLSAADKEKYREYSKELSLVALQFSQHVLKETNKYQLLLTDESK
jgi:peptidyl-dipeptidase Dcp